MGTKTGLNGITFGDATVQNTAAVTGVSSAVAGSGISVSGATGAVTFTNSGVTSIVAGSGISISGGTGAVTVTGSSSYVGGRGQVFTADGTFTVPTGVTAVKVTVIGGGGNGAGVPATNAGHATVGGGGGGAGTAIKYVTGLSPGGTVSVTVGGAAGTSSFGAYCSATGGTTPSNPAQDTQGNGGAGGSGSSGDINLTGGAGSAGALYKQSGSGGGTNMPAAISVDLACAGGYGGVPGAGLFGFGGLYTSNQQNGNAATGYGNGGGGASKGNTTSAYTGGAGTGGIVIVEY